MAASHEPGRAIGTSPRRKEDFRLLTGAGTFADDLRFPHLGHAAVLRSPYAHARIARIDPGAALALPGVFGVLTGADVGRMSRPFTTGMPRRLAYYSCAISKVRYVGEPVAVVVAENRYVAEDACELIAVDYEPLPVVMSAEAAMAPDAPLLHEELGTNVANHRLLTYGDIEAALAGADVVIRQDFKFHKYSSTPIETCVAVAQFDPATEVMTFWSNFHGPYSLHSFLAKALAVPENKLRLIAPPDIGGSFGIKIAIIPYLALLGMAARKVGVPVKWVEDRREHLIGLSSGAERSAHYGIAARRDGTITGLRAKYVDNNGAYIRAPEPANLYRTTGNTPGPYRIPTLQIDAYAVVTNKSPTGPNRGYGCQQLYYCLESMVDLLARELKMDPAEIRRRNLIQPEQFPYTTPSGGVYDSGDYPAGLAKALELADYAALRAQQSAARAERRLVGIGIALSVEPCVSNMGYLNVAYPPEDRAKPDFHVKSGAGEVASVKIDPMGRVTALVSSAPSGQGHEVLVAQVVADELGLTPDDVSVVSEMDTFTRPWTISSGNYASRFASAGLSAFAQASRKLRDKVLAIAAHRFGRPKGELRLASGRVFHPARPDKSLSYRDVAGLAHWNPEALPDGMEPGLQVTHLFNYAPSKVVDERDRVNSSNAYGFIAEVALIEVDPETGEVKILRYVSVHDCGTIINPQRVEGQVYGGVMHGIGGALYEDLAYDENGQFLAGSFMDYLCPTAVEAPTLDIAHVPVPSPFSALGTKGCGEGSAMTAPAVLANAVNDALSPLGVRIHDLPLSPYRVWQALEDARPARKRAHRGAPAHV
jgi:2-furoyl-CoA dehydrogenase large subunit